MKIALQLALIPGRSDQDRSKWAVDHGVEGIELIPAPMRTLRAQVDAIQGRLPVTTVCGNPDADGVNSFEFLHPDRERRRKSIANSMALLQWCGEIGAVGQIVPPIFGPPVVPDLSPVMGPLAIEERLMVAALRELGPVAAAHNTLFLVEPLNRYEQHYLCRQADGVRVIRKAAVDGVGLLCDFFHMHIEETDTPQALLDAADHTAHIHLADNTRMEPGTGDIDFTAAFSALKRTGFKGYMAYECGVTGRTATEVRASLARSIAYLRGCIRKARR